MIINTISCQANIWKTYGKSDWKHFALSVHCIYTVSPDSAARNRLHWHSRVWTLTTYQVVNEYLNLFNPRHGCLGFVLASPVFLNYDERRRWRRTWDTIDTGISDKDVTTCALEMVYPLVKRQTVWVAPTPTSADFCAWQWKKLGRVNVTHAMYCRMTL